jgi:hypothetical protein
MGTRGAIARATAVSASERTGFDSAQELREVLEEVLTELDRDEISGPLLRATGLRLRFEFPDVGLVLNTAAADDPHHHIQWRFSEQAGWKPGLELTMDSEVANRFLQGKESLPIAIARRQVQCRGESRLALLFLPALGLIVEPYRRAIRERHPELALRA